jgi:hypothetical protein
MRDMSMHPGTILFEDADTGTTHTRTVDAVPERIAWADVEGGREPVVRVVSTMRGQQRTIRSYGADGALLSSTVQRPRR